MLRALASLVVLACLGCTAVPGGRDAQPLQSTDAPVEAETADEFPHLADGSIRDIVSCSGVSQGTAERLLITTATTGRDVALPEGVVFTDVEVTSDIGWDVKPVAVVGDNVPFDAFLTNVDPQAPAFEIRELPFAPDGSSEFALGVIVDIPAQSEDNPAAPAAVITGARYDTEGESHRWNFRFDLMVSRLSVEDPEFCSQAAAQAETLGE